MSTPGGAAAAALDFLDALPGQLAAEYTKLAHRGRLEQITAHAAGLRSLIEQLPDEADREAAYTRQILADFDAGKIYRPEPGEEPDTTVYQPDSPEAKARVHPQGVYERLEEALAARDGSAA